MKKNQKTFALRRYQPGRWLDKTQADIGEGEKVFWFFFSKKNFFSLQIGPLHIDGAPAMLTNIEIDDDLLSRAMTATRLASKRAAVEEGLRLLARTSVQAQAVAELRGLGWHGDLDDMRQSGCL